MKGVYRFAVRLFRNGDHHEPPFVPVMAVPYSDQIEAADGHVASVLVMKIMFALRAGYRAANGWTPVPFGYITAPDDTEFPAVTADIPAHLISAEVAAELKKNTVRVADPNPVDIIALVKAA